MSVFNDKANQGSTYHLNLSHWSTWLVFICLASLFAFAVISLTQTGNKRPDIVLFIFQVLGFMGGMKLISYVLSFLTADVMKFVLLAMLGAFALFFLVVVSFSISSGSKSESNQLADQLKYDSSFKPSMSIMDIFASLARGGGIIGSFDWTTAGMYVTALLFGGAIDPTVSPLLIVLNSPKLAILIQGALVVLFFWLEAYRRAAREDWKAFGVGIAGLIDFPVLFFIFSDAFPKIADFGPVAMAVLIPVGLLAGALFLNVYWQGKGDRKELYRDRMSDSMFLYSAMKLVAVLEFVLFFIV